jgi:ADP-heptose:LPS heptosyltransferase
MFARMASCRQSRAGLTRCGQRGISVVMLDAKLMRWLDSVVGNAACSAFALKKKLERPFIRARGPYRKVCVMKFFGMGSIVVASRALLALRDALPGCELHFVTFESNRELLAILGLTDFAYFVDPSTPQAFVRTTLAVAHQLRRASLDLVLDLEFYAKFPLVLASLAGIPAKAGFYLTSESWRRTLLDVPGWYNHYFHTSDIFLSLVYVLAKDDYYYVNFKAFAQQYTYPRLVMSEEIQAGMKRKLEQAGVPASARVFVLNPNTSLELAPEARKWPEERYAQVADRLLSAHPDAWVVYIGVKNESAYVERVRAHGRQRRTVSLAGSLNLRELIALFARASLVVSNDSGPMHLACLVDTAVVGLFFADTPTLFAPRGARTASVAPDLYSIPLFTVYNGKDVVIGKSTVSVTNIAAQSVSVDEVISAATRLLETGTEARAQELAN